MVVLEKPFWMTRCRVAPKLTRARHLRQFDLGRLVDLDGFTVIIDHLHDDIELPILNRPSAGRSTVSVIKTIWRAFASSRSPPSPCVPVAPSRKPGTYGH